MNIGGILVGVYIFHILTSKSSTLRKLFESIIFGGLVTCVSSYYGNNGIFYSGVSLTVMLFLTYNLYIKALEGK